MRVKVKDYIKKNYPNCVQKVWCFDVRVREMLNDDSLLEGKEIFLVELTQPEPIRDVALDKDQD